MRLVHHTTACCFIIPAILVIVISWHGYRHFRLLCFVRNIILHTCMHAHPNINNGCTHLITPSVIITLLNNSTRLVILAMTKKCLSCYREEFHPTIVNSTLESCVDGLHYTGHVVITISAVQNYSSSLERL